MVRQYCYGVLCRCKKRHYTVKIMWKLLSNYKIFKKYINIALLLNASDGTMRCILKMDTGDRNWPRFLQNN